MIDFETGAGHAFHDPNEGWITACMARDCRHCAVNCPGSVSTVADRAKPAYILACGLSTQAGIALEAVSQGKGRSLSGEIHVTLRINRLRTIGNRLVSTHDSTGGRA